MTTKSAAALTTLVSPTATDQTVIGPVWAVGWGAFVLCALIFLFFVWITNKD